MAFIFISIQLATPSGFGLVQFCSILLVTTLRIVFTDIQNLRTPGTLRNFQNFIIAIYKEITNKSLKTNVWRFLTNKQIKDNLKIGTTHCVPSKFGPNGPFKLFTRQVAGEY